MNPRQHDYVHTDATGARYGIRIILDRNGETGLYAGRAETYRGEVENSQFLTNDLMIEPFNAESESAAFEVARVKIVQEVDTLLAIGREANA